MKNQIYLLLALIAIITVVVLVVQHKGELGTPQDCSETPLNPHCFCSEGTEKIGSLDISNKTVYECKNV